LVLVEQAEVVQRHRPTGVGCRSLLIQLDCFLEASLALELLGPGVEALSFESLEHDSPNWEEVRQEDLWEYYGSAAMPSGLRSGLRLGPGFLEAGPNGLPCVLIKESG